MKIYAQNKKVRFDYEILETYEAGIKLKGYETKAAKKGLASLQGAFITTKNNKSYLTNAVIGFWQKANTPKDYNEKRQRELLLKRGEMAEVKEKSKAQGLTLVPTKLYNKRGLVKLEFALVRGKKKYDKRETIKKREAERKINRALKPR